MDNITNYGLMTKVGKVQASLHVHNIIIQLASDDAVLQSYMYYHYYISLSLILEES